MVMHGLEQRSATGRISASHPAQVALINSSRDEGRECFLFKGSGVPIAQPFGGGKRRYQWFWSDQIANTQRRKDCPREGPDVDDASLLIETLQRLQRLTFISKLSVIVILNHD